MKSLLLSSFIVLSFTMFGQKKLLGSAEYGYDLSGNILIIDSNSYHYSSWIGSIDQFKYELNFGEYYQKGTLNYRLSNPLIPYDSTINYYGSSQPLTFINSKIKNTLSGDKILIADISDGSMTIDIKSYYSYHPNGQIQKIINKQYSGGTLSGSDSSWFNYDSFGNQITFAGYDQQTGVLHTTDTSEYQPGTSNLTRFVRYVNYTGTAIPPVKQSENFIIYTGSEVSYIDLFYADNSGIMNWFAHVEYQYAANDLIKISYYPIIGGGIPGSPNAYSELTYNAAGDLLENAYFQNNTITQRDSFFYDLNGFLTLEQRHVPDTTNLLYLIKKKNYYFQNTLSVIETEKDQKTVSVYPNPTTDFVEIQTTIGLKTVEVYNTNGQLLIRQNMAKIDFSQLPSGTYIVNGTTDIGNFSKKVVKE
jgi:hypothetical protein